MTSLYGPLKQGSYRDMQLLHEIGKEPGVTQRDLSKRIGAALGLTNLMLRRFAKKGYIKITSTQKGKIRYLLTPPGLLEKTRLSCEFIHFSLQLYSRMRHLLHQQLSLLGDKGHRRIVLYGTDELSEIACLTIQEMDLQLVSVVSDSPERSQFLGYQVEPLTQIHPDSYDRFVLVSLYRDDGKVQRLAEQGVPANKIIYVSFHSVKSIGEASGKSKDVARPKPAVISSADAEVVILCGGRGTRLGSLTENTPKPLLPVGPYPFLLRLILRLEQEGFTRFILAAHYLSEQFENFLTTYQDMIPNIRLIVEPKPLGTGGALRHALKQVRSSTIVVLNGDSWVTQRIEQVLTDHVRRGRTFTAVAVQASNVEGGALHKGSLKVGPQGEVLEFATEESIQEGWVNAGIYVMDKTLLDAWPQEVFSLEDNLNTLLAGKQAGVYCSSGRLLDIGTTDCYEKAADIFQSTEDSWMVSMEEVSK